MSPSWRPDDSFHDVEAGKLKGVKRVKDALRKGGVRGGRRILTSRDAGMDSLRADLQRGKMPKGFQSWQLPVVLGPDQNMFAFMSVGAPGAEVPEHSHSLDLFRVIISGSVFYKGKELTAGDWMFVPGGSSYGLKAGQHGVVSFHKYAPTPKPPGPKPPGPKPPRPRP
jgi:quercetin dioxygenase-like cupin family protein